MNDATRDYRDMARRAAEEIASAFAPFIRRNELLAIAIPSIAAAIAEAVAKETAELREVSQRIDAVEFSHGETQRLLVNVCNERDALREQLTDLHLRLEELRAERDRTTEAYDRDTKALRRELGVLHSLQAGNFWRWQGDGSDHLESLTCPVSIDAPDLAKILAELTAAREESATLRAAWNRMAGFAVCESFGDHNRVTINYRSLAQAQDAYRAMCEIIGYLASWFKTCNGREARKE